jgi:Putative transposase of IS4/5 family (DUF4096)
VIQEWWPDSRRVTDVDEQEPARYDRSKLRYPSDLTDDEWKLVEPLIPPGKTGGGKRTVILPEVVNGLMYVLSTGWRMTDAAAGIHRGAWRDSRGAARGAGAAAGNAGGWRA